MLSYCEINQEFNLHLKIQQKHLELMLEELVQSL